MEGLLFKWTNYFSGWKERLFTLKGPLLYYYYRRGDKPRGKIHLGIATITAEEDSLFFEINTGSNVFYLQAHDEKERDDWLKAIKIGKLEGEKQIKSTVPSSLPLNASQSQTFQIKPNYEKIMKIANQLRENNSKFAQILHNNKINNPELNNLINKNTGDINEIQKMYDNNFSSSIQNSSPSEVPTVLRSKKPNKNLEENTEKKELIKYYHNKVTGNTLEKDNEILYELSDGDFEEDAKEDDFSEEKTPFKEHIRLKSRQSKQFFPLEKEIGTNCLTGPINYDFNLQTGNDFYDPLYDFPIREKMPVEVNNLDYNVWEILKGAIGKDLNKFGLPVFLNEPLSATQRFCENFQYVDLLNNAAIEPNPYLRLAYCGIFCIGGFAVDVRRKTKFFNPLLFETFEYVDNKRNFTYFAEQVSHHPAITATYAEGKGWTFFTNFNAQLHLRITGKFEIYNLGKCYVTFSNFNENVVFNKPLCVVRNLIIGNLHLDMEGKFEVKNDKGDICEFEMIPSTTGTMGNIKGYAMDLTGKKYVEIEGNWLKEITVKNLLTDEKKTVWKFSKVFDKKSFYFPEFSVNLNYLPEKLKKELAPTDSRLRPDQRLLELQDIDKAAFEKNRLEEKQRAARAKFKKDGIVPKPMYFDETYDDLSGELMYLYKGTYFEDRRKKNFAHFPDIY